MIYELNKTTSKIFQKQLSDPVEPKADAFPLVCETPNYVEEVSNRVSSKEEN